MNLNYSSELLNNWVSPGHFIIIQMGLSFPKTAESDSDSTAIITLRRDEPGPNGVILMARGAVTRSGQPSVGTVMAALCRALQ